MQFHKYSSFPPNIIFSIILLEFTLVYLGGWLCIQYVYVALLRNFTEINFTK